MYKVLRNAVLCRITRKQIGDNVKFQYKNRSAGKSRDDFEKQCSKNVMHAKCVAYKIFFFFIYISYIAHMISSPTQQDIKIF